MKKLTPFILSFVMWSTTAWAGFADAENAYNRGDYATALREFQPLAEQGDAAAQFNIGVMYYIGQGVPQNYAQALKWYRMAANQGDATAQFNIGLMYAKSQGVPQNYAQALIWYRMAADQGDASAQLNLALMYAKGRGVPQNYVRAYSWSSLAAAQGNIPATKVRNLVASLMTAAQVAEGQKITQDWRPTN